MTPTGLPPALAPNTPQQHGPAPQRRRGLRSDDLRSVRLRGATLVGVLTCALALVSGCAPAGDDAEQSPTDTRSLAASPSSSPTTTRSASPSASETASDPASSGSASSLPTPKTTAPSASTTPSPSPSKTAQKSKSGSTGGQQPATLPASNVLVVVNKHTPLSPLEYAPADLVNVGNGQLLRSAAADAYQKLVGGASAAGHNLAASSGYRSYATQVQTHNHWRNQYGAEYAERISARPGYSEHQTGLAIDVMPASGQCRLEVCFGTLPEGQWVAANAHKYGFIIRYPQGQEAVTGYSYEPWHLRYVGVEAATSIKSAGQTMEAYYGYPAAPTYR